VSGGTCAVDSTNKVCMDLTLTGGTPSSLVLHGNLTQVLTAGTNLADHGDLIEFDGYRGAQGGTSTMLTSGVIRLQDLAGNVVSHVSIGGSGLDAGGGAVAF